ncbi:MAG: hypothetical protein IPM13_19100 [Phycisphaerales bacterium]|nr:hypothetical protein [Phycisphaerales bacterium]
MQRLGEDPEHVAAIQMRAGRLFLDADDAAAATPLLEAAHALCVERIPQQWPRGECAALLAECRIAARQWQSAVALAEEGVGLLRGSAAPPERLARAEACLAAANARQDLDR